AGLDQWLATIRPDAVGRWTFAVEAWGDPYRTWRDAVVKKVTAGQGAADLANDLAEGAEILTTRPSRFRRTRRAGSRRRRPRCVTRSGRCSNGSRRAWTWPTCCGSTRCGRW